MSAFEREERASRSTRRLAVGLMIASGFSAVVWALMLWGSWEAACALHVIPTPPSAHLSHVL